MKKCPYCAEMIQDEAIKCRYCFSDLRAAPDEAIAQRPPASAASGGPPDEATTSGQTATPADAVSPGAIGGQPIGADRVDPEPRPVTPDPATTGAATTSPGPGSGGDTAPTSVSSGSGTAVRYTHSGYRYVLGYGSDFFGVWDRQSPSEPAERFPRTDDGWRQAWLRFSGLEPNHVAVPTDGGAVGGGPSTGGSHAEQYTHSGTRYLLGYGADFFGIWERQDPSRPVERFPRTDEGWADAWRRYTQIESHFSEVSLGNSSGS